MATAEFSRFCWHIECSMLGCILLAYWASLIAELVKNPLAVQETVVRFLGQEDPLEKGKATLSSIFAWKIPRTEEPDRLQSMM